LEAAVGRVNSCLGKISGKKWVLGTGKRSHKVTPFHTSAVKSLPCSVKVYVGMEPHAKTPPPPVLSAEVTATQAVELLASVSARTHVSDTDFMAEPVSTPQTQALNQNPSIV